jgi:ribosome assembly protein YihI (activator of Der GTPase)
MTVDISSMTPEELEAHIDRELELRAEIKSLLKRLNNSDYRTKTEKVYLNEKYRELFRELNAHLGIPEEDDE